MKLAHKVLEFSTKHYNKVIFAWVGLAILIALLSFLPSVYPRQFGFLNPVQVDADPQNMLNYEEPVRVTDREMKKKFNLYDIMAVGVVNEKHPDGVFNTETLGKIYQLTEYARTLHWEEDGKRVGVVEMDMIAPSTVDSIEPGEGVIKFEWLMNKPPKTREEALEIRRKALRIPFLKDTLVSTKGDIPGRALAIYLPLTDKKLSYGIYKKLMKKIEELPKGDDVFHVYITGLPVAENTFVVEMFLQMAISGPTAMLIIFILLYFFFRKLVLIVSPMIVAFLSVIFTMGSFIVCGFPIHVLSSMIPIFIMPVSVLDSIHVLSEFFDRYQETRDRKKTIIAVIKDLFMPMLYTTLTSAAGFGSLVFAPIPPVQLFGVFVAFGIIVAWLLTVTFIPAYVMLISPKTLENFGTAFQHHQASLHKKGPHKTLMDHFLSFIGKVSYYRSKMVLCFTVVIVVISVYGISRININDNPVKWFGFSHPIRIADRELNKYFAGTYMAYLAVSAEESRWEPEKTVGRIIKAAEQKALELGSDFPETANTVMDQVIEEAKSVKAGTKEGYFDQLIAGLQEKFEQAEGEAFFVWDEAQILVERQRIMDQVFKDPEVLNYLVSLDEAMRESQVVGKSNSIADIVRTVHRDLLSGDPVDYRIPDNRQMVAECLIQYENGHRPHELWHFISNDYRMASMWVQLKNGDNNKMQAVVDKVDHFIKNNPPPVPLSFEWFGTTYINVIWQQKMVAGMLEALGGSYVIVLILMTILFRNLVWGILSMIPLTMTITLVYGVVGLVGKDYDMPVAVLSSLSLGLAVDFAIHLLARSRDMYRYSWENTIPHVFGEPARAMTRNIIVTAIGFLPLIFTPLIPYRTVGVLLASILLISGIATLMILPALLRTLERFLFRKERKIEAVELKKVA